MVQCTFSLSRPHAQACWCPYTQTSYHCVHCIPLTSNSSQSPSKLYILSWSWSHPGPDIHFHFKGLSSPSPVLWEKWVRHLSTLPNHALSVAHRRPKAEGPLPVQQSRDPSTWHTQPFVPVPPSHNKLPKEVNWHTGHTISSVINLHSIPLSNTPHPPQTKVIYICTAELWWHYLYDLFKCRWSYEFTLKGIVPSQMKVCQTFSDLKTGLMPR
jgi:hypothetical protein